MDLYHAERLRIFERDVEDAKYYASIGDEDRAEKMFAFASETLAYYANDKETWRRLKSQLVVAVIIARIAGVKQ